MAQSGLTTHAKGKQAAELAAANTVITSNRVSGASGLTASTTTKQAAELAAANTAFLSNQQ